MQISEGYDPRRAKTLESVVSKLFGGKATFEIEEPLNGTHGVKQDSFPASPVTSSPLPKDRPPRPVQFQLPPRPSGVPSSASISISSPSNCGPQSTTSTTTTSSSSYAFTSQVVRTNVEVQGGTGGFDYSATARILQRSPPKHHSSPFSNFVPSGNVATSPVFHLYPESHHYEQSFGAIPISPARTSVPHVREGGKVYPTFNGGPLSPELPRDNRDVSTSAMAISPESYSQRSPLASVPSDVSSLTPSASSPVPSDATSHKTPQSPTHDIESPRKDIPRAVSPKDKTTAAAISQQRQVGSTCSEKHSLWAAPSVAEQQYEEKSFSERLEMLQTRGNANGTPGSSNKTHRVPRADEVPIEDDEGARRNLDVRDLQATLTSIETETTAVPHPLGLKPGRVPASPKSTASTPYTTPHPSKNVPPRTPPKAQISISISPHSPSSIPSMPSHSELGAPTTSGGYRPASAPMPQQSTASPNYTANSRSQFLEGMTDLERKMAEVKANNQLSEQERSRLLKSILADYLRQRNLAMSSKKSPHPTMLNGSTSAASSSSPAKSHSAFSPPATPPAPVSSMAPISVPSPPSILNITANAPTPSSANSKAATHACSYHSPSTALNPSANPLADVLAAARISGTAQAHNHRDVAEAPLPHALQTTPPLGKRQSRSSVSPSPNGFLRIRSPSPPDLMATPAKASPSPLIFDTPPTSHKPRSPPDMTHLLSPGQDSHLQHTEPKLYARSPTDVSKSETSTSIHPDNSVLTEAILLPFTCTPPAGIAAPLSSRSHKAPSPTPEMPTAPPLQRPVDRPKSHVTPLVEPPPQAVDMRVSPPRPSPPPPCRSPTNELRYTLPVSSPPAAPRFTTDAVDTGCHDPILPSPSSVGSLSSLSPAIYGEALPMRSPHSVLRSHGPDMQPVPQTATLPSRGLPLMQGTRLAMKGNPHAETHGSPVTVDQDVGVAHAEVGCRRALPRKDEEVHHIPAVIGQVMTAHHTLGDVQQKERRPSSEDGSSPTSSSQVMTAHYGQIGWRREEHRLDIEENLQLSNVSWHRIEDSDAETERPTFTIGHALQLVKARGDGIPRPPSSPGVGSLQGRPLPKQQISNTLGSASTTTDISCVSSIPVQSQPAPSSPSLGSTLSPGRMGAVQERAGKALRHRRRGRPSHPHSAASLSPHPDWWGHQDSPSIGDSPRRHSFASHRSIGSDIAMIPVPKSQVSRTSPTPKRIIRQPLHQEDGENSTSDHRGRVLLDSHAGAGPIGVVSTYRNQAVFMVQDVDDDSSDHGGHMQLCDDDDIPSHLWGEGPRLERRRPPPLQGSVGRLSPSVSISGHSSNATRRTPRTTTASEPATQHTRTSPFPIQPETEVSPPGKHEEHSQAASNAPGLPEETDDDFLFDPPYSSGGAPLPMEIWTPRWESRTSTSLHSNACVWQALRQYQSGPCLDDDSD